MATSLILLYSLIFGNALAEENTLLPKEYGANGTYPNAVCLESADIECNTKEELRGVVRYVKNRIQQGSVVDWFRFVSRAPSKRQKDG
jgi:hypothetical protein